MLGGNFHAVIVLDLVHGGSEDPMKHSSSDEGKPFWAYDPVEMTPEEFELEVKRVLEAEHSGLTSVRTTHREIIVAGDGSYQIDVTARFEALSLKFLVLVECKHQKKPVEREVVQVLYDRLRATGAQKGVLFATTSFQKGAIDYAKVHGIALVQVVDGMHTYITKAADKPRVRPPWVPKFAAFLMQRSEDGGTHVCNLTADAKYLKEALMG